MTGPEGNLILFPEAKPIMAVVGQHYGPQLSNDDDEGSENVAKKNEFAFFRTQSRLFGPTQYVKCRRLFMELNS